MEEQIKNLHYVRDKMGKIEFYGENPPLDDSHKLAILSFFRCYEFIDEMCQKYPLTA